MFFELLNSAVDEVVSFFDDFTSPNNATDKTLLNENPNGSDYTKAEPLDGMQIALNSLKENIQKTKQLNRDLKNSPINTIKTKCF